MAQITITNRAGETFTAFFDDDDYPVVAKRRWHIQKAGRQTRLFYARTSIGGGKTMLMHHLIIGRAPGLVVDHKDGDGLNNRRDNLRHVTQSENAASGRFPSSHDRMLHEALGGRNIPKKRMTPALAYDLWTAQKEQNADAFNATGCKTLQNRAGNRPAKRGERSMKSSGSGRQI